MFAIEEATFPVDVITTVLPNSNTLEIATEIGLSLNEPVGFLV